MRISTAWSQQLGVNGMLDRQAKLTHTQMQLASGKKILTASDNAAAAARSVDLNYSINQTNQYQSNIDAAQQRLELEDGLLQSAVNILHRVKELAIQGMSGANTQTDRDTIALEIEELNDNMLGLANTRNSNGEYVFSGYKSTVPAFAKDTKFDNAYVYQGDEHFRSIQISVERQVADGDPGTKAFGNPSVATATEALKPGSIENVFEAMTRFTHDLRTNNADTASLDDFDNALERMLVVESSVGVRLNALDNQRSLNEDFILNMKTVLSSTEDLDYTEAISRFNLENMTLQAAQQAFSQVKKLSLFNYL